MLGKENLDIEEYAEYKDRASGRRISPPNRTSGFPQ